MADPKHPLQGPLAEASSSRQTFIVGLYPSARPSHKNRICRFFRFLNICCTMKVVLSGDFFIFYFYIKFESLLGVERCLFVFVLDSQWKRAPPCHSNSPEAKLLSPDGEPTHDISFFVMMIIMMMQMIIRIRPNHFATSCSKRLEGPGFFFSWIFWTILPFELGL